MGWLAGIEAEMEKKLPPMTACACAGMSFEEIAQKIKDSKQGWQSVCKKLGCGVTCTACVPDLKAYLRERNLVRKGKSQ